MRKRVKQTSAMEKLSYASTLALCLLAFMSFVGVLIQADLANSSAHKFGPVPYAEDGKSHAYMECIAGEEVEVDPFSLSPAMDYAAVTDLKGDKYLATGGCVFRWHNRDKASHPGNGGEVLMPSTLPGEVPQKFAPGPIASN